MKCWSGSYSGWIWPVFSELHSLEWWKTNVSSYSQSPLIRYLSNLQITRTGIKAQLSSNLGGMKNVCDGRLVFWIIFIPWASCSSGERLLPSWATWTDFDLKIDVGHYDLYFMVQWFYVISWRLFNVWTYFGIMGQYDAMFDLKINVDHCDLNFMVQWFSLIFWRLFHPRMSYLE